MRVENSNRQDNCSSRWRDNCMVWICWEVRNILKPMNRRVFSSDYYRVLKRFRKNSSYPLQKSQLNRLLEKWKHFCPFCLWILLSQMGWTTNWTWSSISGAGTAMVPDDSIIYDQRKKSRWCRNGELFSRQQDQRLRFCEDNGNLNSSTKRDAYCLPVLKKP